MDVPSLKLSPRSVKGKKVRALRRQGVVPVHVYGKGVDPQALEVEAQVLRRLLPRVGTNVPLSVTFEGETDENLCFVREVQRHPVTEDLLHVDFLRVDVSQSIRAEVPIVLLGDSPAVRQLGGTLLQPLQSILVESLPMNVPASFEVDASELDDFEKGIYVRDLTADPSVAILTDADEMIARVAQPRIEVVEEEAVAAEALEEGEAAAAEEAGAEAGTPPVGETES